MLKYKIPMTAIAATLALSSNLQASEHLSPEDMMSRARGVSGGVLKLEDCRASIEAGVGSYTKDDLVIVKKLIGIFNGRGLNLLTVPLKKALILRDRIVAEQAGDKENAAPRNAVPVAQAQAPDDEINFDPNEVLGDSEDVSSFDFKDALADLDATRVDLNASMLDPNERTLVLLSKRLDQLVAVRDACDRRIGRAEQKMADVNKTLGLGRELQLEDRQMQELRTGTSARFEFEHYVVAPAEVMKRPLEDEDMSDLWMQYYGMLYNDDGFKKEFNRDNFPTQIMALYNKLQSTVTSRPTLWGKDAWDQSYSDAYVENGTRKGIAAIPMRYFLRMIGGS